MLVQGSGGGSAPTTTAKAASGGSVSPSYAPIITLALQLAKAAQLPQTQAIHNAQAQSDAAARAQAASISGYTAALAPILAHIAPAVQQGYTQAAGLDALLGKGFGNDLGTDQGAANSQAQSILNNSGGQAQLGGVQQAIGGQGVQNALGFLNGGLPAQGLNQAGAAFGAAAKTLPASFAGQGTQELGSLAAKQQLVDQGFGQKLTDLAAQLPGLVSNNALSIQQQQELQSYHNQEVRISQQRANDTAAYQRGELNAREYANKIAAYNANSRRIYDQTLAKLSSERVGISQQNANTSATRLRIQTAPKYSASVSRSLGYRADQYGNPIGGKITPLPGFTSGADGAIVKTSSSTKAKQLTPEQLQKYTGEISDTVGFLFTGVPATATAPGKPRLGYADALKFMRQHGYMATPQLAKLTIDALKQIYGATETGIASGKLAGPPVPSSTTAPNT